MYIIRAAPERSVVRTSLPGRMHSPYAHTDPCCPDYRDSPPVVCIKIIGDLLENWKSLMLGACSLGSQRTSMLVKDYIRLTFLRNKRKSCCQGSDWRPEQWWIWGHLWQQAGSLQGYGQRLWYQHTLCRKQGLLTKGGASVFLKAADPEPALKVFASRHKITIFL